ncbi:MAG: hypothetical protein JWM80_731 [Cyanobacteria bacterium RYN_339]|nr:hypothetical protein [Cyanobacteria bacterium RYN_339]
MATDLVPSLGCGTDHKQDGHFSVDLYLPWAVTINTVELAMFHKDKVQAAWSTENGRNKPTEQFLGVLNHGTRLLNGPVASIGTFAAGSYHWDVYAAAGGSAFKHEDPIRATVTFQGRNPVTSQDVFTP